ncbi:MAG: FAD-dependent oxidoreductase [Rhodospirillaceae bacterium]|nr:FAD-dependent oxidoreductase [Rhodospirillaceae bacterium]
MKVVIVGGGIVGLSTAWALMRAGHQPVVLEQGTAPNPLGSSYDEHRMTRLFYPEPSGYGAMVPEAMEAYDTLWADLGERHYRETGILGLSRESGDWIDAAMPQIEHDRYKFERLTAKQLARRWPFLDTSDVAYGVFMKQGGVLFAERIVCALALKLGDRVRPQTPVIALDPEKNAARLDDGTLVGGDALIVAAGPWIGRLVPSLAARSQSYRHVAVYLDAPQKFRAAWNEAPAIVDFGGAGDIYAFPSVDRTPIKIASGEYRRPGEPDESRAVDPGEPSIILERYRGRLLDLDGYTTIDARSCCYTMTDDHRFIAERVGDNAVAISLCSGHGFKFGAVLGLKLAAAVTGALDYETLTRWIAGRG